MKPSTIEKGDMSQQIKPTIITGLCTSLSFWDLTACSSTRPTALRTPSSSENHASCTLLTLLHSPFFLSDTQTLVNIYKKSNITIFGIWYTVTY